VGYDDQVPDHRHYVDEVYDVAKAYHSHPDLEILINGLREDLNNLFESVSNLEREVSELRADMNERRDK